MNCKMVVALFLAAALGVASVAGAAERDAKAVVWGAADGRGGVVLLWSPLAGWPPGGFRLERISGSAVEVVAGRIAPLGDAAAVAALGAEERAEVERLAADLSAGGDAARRAAAAAFLRSATAPAVGLALGLRAVDAGAGGECRYRISGLGRKGETLWHVETGPFDPRRVTPALSAPADLVAESEGSAVRLRWTPPRGDGFAALTFAVERRAGGETRALTTRPTFPLRAKDDPERGFRDEEPPYGAEATYRLTLYDVLGRPSPPAETTMRVPDLPALLAPVGVLASAEPGRIVVSWTPSKAAGAAGYVLERSLLERGPFAPLRSEPLPRDSARYVDEDVADGTTYYYRLRSRARDGGLGEPSAVARVEARGTTPPPAPEGLAAEAGRTRVRLVWRPVPGPVSGYLVERQTASGQWARLNPDYSAEPRFDDRPGAQDGVVLRYRVSTVSHRGALSAPSEVLTVRLADTVAPPEPRIVGLRAEKAGVLVEFLPGAPAASTAAFRVLRSARRDDLGLVLGPPLAASARSFADPSARPGEAYFYRVIAVDAAGNRSAPSEPLRVSIAWPAVPAAPAPQVESQAKPFPHVRVRCPEAPAGLGVVVERRLADEDTFVVLGTLAGGQREFLDAQPSLTKSASYRVVYRDAAGAHGPPSATAETAAARRER